METLCKLRMYSSLFLRPTRIQDPPCGDSQFVQRTRVNTKGPVTQQLMLTADAERK